LEQIESGFFTPDQHDSLKDLASMLHNHDRSAKEIPGFSILFFCTGFMFVRILMTTLNVRIWYPKHIRLADMTQGKG
jgi:hypothetical protein